MTFFQLISRFCGLAVLLMLFIHVESVPCADKKVTNRPVEKKKKFVSDKAALETAQKAWEAILNTIPNDPKLKQKGGIGYWTIVVRKAFPEFRKLYDGTNQRTKFKFYVEQFGKHGSQADMCWLMMARTYVLLSTTKLGDKNSKEYYGIKRYKAQTLIAEYQVLQFTKNPAMLKRFYEATIWYHPYDGFFRWTSFSHIVTEAHKHMKDNEDEAYWWYARNFMLMAYATGREDLLKDIKPDKLQPQFVKWIKWLKVNGVYLRGSPKEPRWILDEGEKKRKEGYVPFLEYKKMELPPLKVKLKYPFPDWKGPKPGTPEEHFGIE